MSPVTQVLDGGLCVNVDEARVFIPASLVSDTYEKDLSKYADQEIEFVITEFNPRRRRIIGNRKQLLLAEKAEKQKEFKGKRDLLSVDLFDKNFDFIANGKYFLRVLYSAPGHFGDVKKSVCSAQISREHVAKPADVLSIGQEIEAKVVDFNGEDKKISLSMKALEAPGTI